MAETSSDWVELVEPGWRMFVNLTSGECGWQPPAGVAVRQADGNQWWELFDSQSGRFYYYNSSTRQTVWHRPLAGDILPLAQLQAMKRSSMTHTCILAHTPLGPTHPLAPLPPSLISSYFGRETPSRGQRDMSEGFTDSRGTSQRWQPAPGSKAAMLVKVSNADRNQSASLTGSQRLVRPGSPGGSAPGDRPRPPAKMEPKHTPVSSKAAPPIYDEPPHEPPIYEDPPPDMLAHTRLLQYPAPQPPRRHTRHPSDTEYSPAGRECIKHMVNVEPAVCKTAALYHPSPQYPLSPPPLPSLPALPSPPLPQTPTDAPDHETWGSPSPAFPSTSSQPHPQPHPQPQTRELSLEKAASWRLLEASVRRNMEPRHSRQNSLANQEYPAPATVTYQDSGYSTGPSPSVRRRRRALEGVAGARPGSLGSSGELSVVSERLMAKRDSRVSLETQLSEGSTPRSSLQALARPGGPRDNLTSSSHSLTPSANNHGDSALSTLAADGEGCYKPTYGKKMSLDASILSSPENPCQAGSVEGRGQMEPSQPQGVTGQVVARDRSQGVGGRRGGGAGGGGGVYQYTPWSQPPPDSSIEAWANQNLNVHTQGLFRRRLSLASMLAWSPASIKKPMLASCGPALRKQACEMFRLVQVYMGERSPRSGRLPPHNSGLTLVTWGWSVQGLRDELYVQLVKQTTDNPGLASLRAGWELLAICLAFFSPSASFTRYLQAYIHKHMEPSHDDMITWRMAEQQDARSKKNSKSRKKRKQNTEGEEEEGLPISTYAKYCYRKLQKVALTGGKKGLRKPSLEELCQGRRAIVTPSLFGSSLEEVMERQALSYPERRLPWVQVQLSLAVLALGGAHTEGIFRVPGDIDEVNALKLQVDQWNIPENLPDPNVPASLLKLWYRELEEPLIPQSFYQDCVSNHDDPESAVRVVQSLPELNRLVLCYFIHFLQVFAQPVNVSKTKMDVNNLAMVMAPNCLRCQSDEPLVIFQNTRREMSFLRTLIVHLDTTDITSIT
ncbi:rho GTPase-activating protein 39-like isoform X1 [Osmerus eperlanus]|uniref:rho GTPase-activating protein 39-like isoform X1 n=2 Tax=Osmerus eperlanus TaxID=29151 RepID=UPI002E112B73